MAADSANEEIESLRRELAAVDAERLRLRSELEQVELSPVGPMVGPSRTARSIVERRLRRLRRRFPRRRPRTARATRLAPPFSGSELAWSVRSRLRPRAPAWRPNGASPSTDWLTPILVDSFGRDGSTLMMALLATSPQIVVEETYPYERHYFTYLWRWARLLGREDWPAALWRKEDVVSLWQDDHSALLGPPPWLPRELFEAGPDRAAISRRAFELVWGELSSRAIERAAATGGARPRYSAEKHGNTWLVDERELPPLETVVLLRDPRDVEVSMAAYEDKEPSTSVGINARWAGIDRLDGVLARHRDRLRWIAGLLDEGTVPVVRFEELAGDLAAVARRLGERLGVELAPESLAAEALAARHASAPDAGAGRWRAELDPAIAERFSRELGPELRAVGLDD